MGCVYAYVILLTFLGPEMKGRSMSARDDEDLEEAAGPDAFDTLAEPGHRHGYDDDGIQKA